MENRKIVFIHSNPLVPRLKRAFLIDEFISRGFGVEYWEIQKLVRPVKERVHFPDKLQEDFITEFETLPQFLAKLDEQDNSRTVFIVQVWERWMSRRVFYALARRRCYMICLHIYSQVEKGTDSLGFFESMKKWRVTAEEKLKVSVYQAWKRWKGYKTFGHIFGISPPKTHSINRPDYELFRQVKANSGRLLEEKYAVFLDVYFAQHAESRYLSTRSDELASEYRRSMNRFFDWFEKEYQCEVVIAAHPSSDYSTEWSGRKVIKNKTAELVKDAEVVLTHVSASNVLAVLFRKPMIYVVNSAMKEFYFGRDAIRTSHEAAYFGKTAYDIDVTPFPEIKATVINEDLRKKYLYEHVTSPESENRSNAEIVIEELNQIFECLGRGEWPAQPVKSK